jgi:hypothetical protein
MNENFEVVVDPHKGVFYRKLGHLKADGIYSDDGRIFVDPRLNARATLYVLIHEMLHHHFPSLTEEQTEAIAHRMEVTLTEERFVRMEN